MNTARLIGDHGGLLIIDIQEKLLPKVPRGPLVVANAERLIRAARASNMPVWATEQYPRGLGPTVGGLIDLLPIRWSKTSFSSCGAAELLEQLHGRGVRHLTLAGIEAHVCVAQTALDLLNMGLVVQVPADAVASRFELDWEIALRRLERAGAVLTTTEAVLFEWVQTAEHPAFKTISSLVKDFVPPPLDRTSSP